MGGKPRAGFKDFSKKVCIYTDAYSQFCLRAATEWQLASCNERLSLLLVVSRGNVALLFFAQPWPFPV